MLLKFGVMDLRRFLQLSSKRERADVAAGCRSTVSYLYQLAGKHRYASALLATRIEKSTQKVALRSNGRLAAVSRESLVRYPEIFADINEHEGRP